jgi:hypothetical protein
MKKFKHWIWKMNGRPLGRAMLRVEIQNYIMWSGCHWDVMPKRRYGGIDARALMDDISINLFSDIQDETFGRPVFVLKNMIVETVG